MMYSIIFFNYLSKIYNSTIWILIVLYQVLARVMSTRNTWTYPIWKRVADSPILQFKTNNKVPGKFKRQSSSKVIEEFIALSPKTYCFKDCPKSTKEKGIKNCNNAKHEEHYSALMYYTERSVDECRIQKVGDNMTTTKTSKISLNTFDDKRFHVKIIKSYSHDEILYLFKRDLVKKICEAGWGTKTKSPFLIKNASLDGDKDLLVNNILELTINDDKK